ncbi:hypothetical protein VTI74DRAFT_3209 [Chaetomium olivicolor]
MEESARPPSSGFAAPRRVFTAPSPSAAPQSRTTPQPAGGLVDTLYDHPNVKIIAFTAGARFLSIGPRTAGHEVEPGSLSWTSQLERTIAVGPFRIYRAPGSVAFLSCGSALQPILPKSQVWCVDEESSKFVLQVRRPQYWRIELPVRETEDVERAQQLRSVFDTILLFEKTECPFKRSFTVELPERPPTPIRKRPWTPVRRSSASLPLTPVTPVEIARLHEGTPRGSICMGDLRTPGEARRALREHARTLRPVEEPVSRESVQPGPRPGDGDVSPSPLRPSVSQSSSGVPQQIPRIAVPRTKAMDSPIPTSVPAQAARFESPTTSSESFHKAGPWLSPPLPPSPPLSATESPRSASPQPQAEEVAATPAAQEDIPDLAVTSKSSQRWSVASAESFPESECSATTAPSSPLEAKPSTSTPSAPTEIPEPTPTLADELPKEPTTPTKDTAASTTTSPPTAVSSTSTSPSTSPGTCRPQIRRATTSSSISPSRRALSPLPPAADLFTPRHQPLPFTLTTTSPTPPRSTATTSTSPSLATTTNGTSTGPLATVRRLPMTVLHKTCEILLSPPSHLLSLMLNVAARIAAGEWRGLVFAMGEGGERVSVTWDWSEDDEEEDLGVWGRGRRRGAAGRGTGMGWATGSEWSRGYGRNAGGNVEGDWWGQKRDGEKGAEERSMKMAGSFPESDDDEEEDVGPLDKTRLRGRSQPPDRKEAGAGQGEMAKAKEEADAEWGVD